MKGNDLLLLCDFNAHKSALTDSLFVLIFKKKNFSKTMSIFMEETNYDCFVSSWIQKSLDVTLKHKYTDSSFSLQYYVLLTVSWKCPSLLQNTYFGSSCGCAGVFLHQGKISEELWQKFGDFPSNGPGGVLLFG